jgi:hypothetical protein
MQKRVRTWKLRLYRVQLPLAQSTFLYNVRVSTLLFASLLVVCTHVVVMVSGCYVVWVRCAASVCWYTLYHCSCTYTRICQRSALPFFTPYLDPLCYSTIHLSTSRSPSRRFLWCSCTILYEFLIFLACSVYRPSNCNWFYHPDIWRTVLIWTYGRDHWGRGRCEHCNEYLSYIIRGSF